MRYTRFSKAVFAKYLIGAILIVAAMLFLSGCRKNQEEQIRGQLEALDQRSYDDIRYWVGNHFVDFEDVSLSLRTVDETGYILGNGFFHEDERFIEWEFYFLGDVLFLEIIYEEHDLMAELLEELAELDATSLGDVIGWLEWMAEEHDEVYVLTNIIDTTGEWLCSEIIVNEERFALWTFEQAEDFTIVIDIIYERVRRITLGETFYYSGLMVTIEEGAVWGIVNDETSRDYGIEFFMVPVSLKNIERESHGGFSVRQLAPNGEELNWLVIPRANDNITAMGSLRPGGVREGFIYVRFCEDGEYVFEMMEEPFVMEIAIDIDSERLRREMPPPIDEAEDNCREIDNLDTDSADADSTAEDTITGEATVDDLAQELEEEFADVRDALGDLLELEITTRGEREILLTFTYHEVVSVLERPFYRAYIETLVDDMEEDLLLRVQDIMGDLGLESVVLTYLFVDRDGTEILRRSVDI